MAEPQESRQVPPHLTDEARRHRNMVNMRRRREITVMRAIHQLFLNCQCQVYLNIHHTDEDKHVVYNSEPGENFPVDYSRLRNYYPKPQINTPNNPQYLLKKALARIASEGEDTTPGGHTSPGGHTPSVQTTGDQAAPENCLPAELSTRQPATPPFSPPSMSSPPLAPRKRSVSLPADHESRIVKSPSRGRYNSRNRRGKFSK